MLGKYFKDGKDCHIITGEKFYEFYKNKPRRCSEYYFEIGDILIFAGQKIQILSYYKFDDNKYYRVRCLNCGYEYGVKEGNLFIQRGCPVCANKTVVQGINDIATTDPDMVKYFVDPTVPLTHVRGSNEKTDFCCDICHSVQPNQQISYIMSNGFRCHECMDGITKPNKIMRKVLDLMGINYDPEHVFAWAKDKRYDFYLEEYNMIIEMQGQHHTSNIFINRGHYKENDIIKYNLAMNNGIDKYITIDSLYPEFDFIISNILQSELDDIFDIKNKLDIEECRRTYDESFLVKACNIWNENKPISTVKIGEILKISGSAAFNYLCKGRSLELCDYDPNYRRTHKAELEKK